MDTLKKSKRCKNGTRKHKKTGNCEKYVLSITKRCKNGTRKNKKTGNCDKIELSKLSPLTNSNSNMNSMTKQRYDDIKLKYGGMSSWAIWAESDKKIKSGMGDISFFENPTKETLDKLNPSVILVGLNISKKIPRTFGNFHPNYSSAQDYKTRYALKDTMFWGAYMTDIIKDFEELVAGNLMKYLNKNKSFEKENAETFEQELLDIGAENPIIIALGNDSYKILKRNFKNLNIYKVPHYSAFITKEKLRLEFEKLEENINDI